MKKITGRLTQEKTEEIVKLSSIAVLNFLSDLGYEIGFSYEMLERCIRDSFSSSDEVAERDRLFSVLDAMRQNAQKNGVETRAVTLAKKLLPALPNRDVWLVTQTEEGGVRLENALAQIEVVTKIKQVRND